VILLWGPDTDGPLHAVCAALDRMGASVFLVNQRRAAETDMVLTGVADVAGQIRVAGEQCDLVRVVAAYVRCHIGRAVATGAAQDEELARHADRLDCLMAAFLDITNARVVNTAESMATNGSKPYQASIIAAHGFAVPDTLITTETAAVAAFASRHGQVIYKSISGVRSIVQRLGREDADRLADIAWCPTQFQQYIPGRDYRVHVVGDAIFTAEIVSEADDYRYAARVGEDTTVQASRIPAFLEDRCRALAAALGLVVAGIDLRLTPQGEWYCFEVNPSPAFTFYAAATGQPVAEAIAALLAAG